MIIWPRMDPLRGTLSTHKGKHTRPSCMHGLTRRRSLGEGRVGGRRAGWACEGHVQSLPSHHTPAKHSPAQPASHTSLIAWHVVHTACVVWRALWCDVDNTRHRQLDGDGGEKKPTRQTNVYQIKHRSCPCQEY